ncbi:MAG: HAD-IG family 5'-nucleotidase [Bacteroidota bacterium]
MNEASNSHPVFEGPEAPGGPRDLFCNRTLNVRGLKAIGYDMDYTLVHYNVEHWERRAFEYVQDRLVERGWPVQHLSFDPELVIRGLILDVELGNVVKTNQFGFVKRAFHGTQSLEYTKQREVYAQTLVDLHERRWVFLNTLFSLSEACLYMQLVDLLDDGQLPKGLGYAELYGVVRSELNETHLEGRLKAEIIADPSQFVDLDPEMPLALLDQKLAGKKLVLATNSEWEYAAPMLAFAFDRYLPGDMTWRELFDISIVGSRKPDFFLHDLPAFEIVNEEGLLREHRGAYQNGGIYLGGCARLVEQSLGVTGEEILYVGDHMFSDVRISKSQVKWRTALVLRELEDELTAIHGFEASQSRLTKLMAQKQALEAEFSSVRVEALRIRRGYSSDGTTDAGDLDEMLKTLREQLVALDEQISPLAQASATLRNPNWGLLLRAGNDKSHLAYQIERYADIYTSRVSNFLDATPFVYLRSARSLMAHDPA